jgi:hypothetical protein
LKKILTVLFTIMVLTACSSAETINNNYKFIGESEHWKAEYSYSGTELWGEEDGKTTYSNEDNYEFVLKYKGSLEEMASMKKLEYSYKTSAGSGSGTEEFTKPPREVVFTSKGSSSGAKVSEDEVIQVHVKWDDFEESFELHNKSK